MLHFNVVFLLCRCSLFIFDAFLSVLVCNPDLFFSLSFYEFRTALHYCCLYLEIEIKTKEYLVRPTSLQDFLIDLHQEHVCPYNNIDHYTPMGVVYNQQKQSWLFHILIVNVDITSNHCLVKERLKIRKDIQRTRNQTGNAMAETKEEKTSNRG